MELEISMVNSALMNESRILEQELKAQCIPNVRLYQTGNMQDSIHSVIIDQNRIMVIIGAKYASQTNYLYPQLEGWIDKTVKRVDQSLNTNISVTLNLGM